MPGGPDKMGPCRGDVQAVDMAATRVPFEVWITYSHLNP